VYNPVRAARHAGEEVHLIFLAGFLALGITFAGTRPALMAWLYALGVAVSLGLIGIFIKDVHEQGVSEKEKIIWSILFVVVWPSMWVYSCLFGLGWRKGQLV
jgi:hypothetical protein